MKLHIFLIVLLQLAFITWFTEGKFIFEMYSENTHLIGVTELFFAIGYASIGWYLVYSFFGLFTGLNRKSSQKLMGGYQPSRDQVKPSNPPGNE